LEEIDEVRQYTNSGPLVSRLEERLAKKLGEIDARRVVLCSNATLALQGCMQLSKAKDWHLPSFTFAATALAAVQSGKFSWLQDINSASWTIDPNVLVDPDSEGIVNVLPFGAEFNFAAYGEVEHLIIDAAASLGGAYSWIHSLKTNWAAVFSLHATKCFGIGEGGLVVFGSESQASLFRSWINFGFLGSRVSQNIGTNAKMSEFQAAVGLGVLDNWESELDEWATVRRIVDQATMEFNLMPPPEALSRPNLISPYWIVYNESPRVVDRLRFELQNAGVGTRSWWMTGVHQMPAFKDLRKGSLENTEHIGVRYLGLPFFRDMNPEAVAYIAGVIRKAI
jgi:dTDP-4-amino-4,6-dideoxygalactose transaminase